ncbi:MAG TPA: hypothetical protein VF796_16150 [Humisphaera sp.]
MVPRPAAQNTVHPLGYAKPQPSRRSLRLRGMRDWLREELRAYLQVAIALFVGLIFVAFVLMRFLPRTTFSFLKWLNQ